MGEILDRQRKKSPQEKTEKVFLNRMLMRSEGMRR